MEAFRAVRFTFDHERSWAGFTDGSRWNGFLNVWVTAAVRNKIAQDVTMWVNGPEERDEFLALPPGPFGLVSLANGYATQEVPGGNVRSFLDLSTAHLDAASRSYLEVNASQYVADPDHPSAWLCADMGDGWMVYAAVEIDGERTLPPDMPKVLRDALNHAYLHGCAYAMFNRDAPADVEPLPTFDDAGIIRLWSTVVDGTMVSVPTPQHQGDDDCTSGDCRHTWITSGKTGLTTCETCGREQEAEDDPDACTNPGGHQFQHTGTAYGGDDPRWHGEGRSICIHCGADGDA